MLTVYPGRDFDLGTLKLDRGRVFTGQVLDALGKPRPNAVISPGVARYQLGHTYTDIGHFPTLTTNSDGRFRTRPLPVGHLQLTSRVSSMIEQVCADVITRGRAALTISGRDGKVLFQTSENRN